MKLRRGFKSEANQLAREMRAELRLAFHDPLDPWVLAKHLSIPVVKLTDIRDLSEFGVRYFTSTNTSDFSALTVFRGPKRLILHNDSHSKGRQASNIAHELSHGLLLHSPGPVMDENGCRDWNQEMENEAEWLSGALLISEEAALHIAKSNLTNCDAASIYGVSKKMVAWRLQVTAAYKRVGRMQRAYKK